MGSDTGIIRGLEFSCHPLTSGEGKVIGGWNGLSMTNDPTHLLYKAAVVQNQGWRPEEGQNGNQKMFRVLTGRSQSDDRKKVRMATGRGSEW